ncbi:mucin-19-like [Cyprinus carpio]|uniref:Mucin-19-like n=1 Tax=Cyprinus carpio TaxID=7962 RepID=A0A9Q9YHU2_CYPCA|nr:mucin-19-like [Cyprinus carpio]
MNQYALGYSKPISSPQISSSHPTSALSSRKQYSSAPGSSGAQFGATTGLLSQGVSSSYSSSVQSQAGPSTTVQGSQKQLPSSYTGSSGTQAGSSNPFTLHGSTAYGGSRQPQGTTSQSAPGPPSSYPGLSLSSRQGVASKSSSQKRFTFTFMGRTGTKAGSSTPFILHGSPAYGGSHQPQDMASQSAPGPHSSYASVSLSSPQAVAGPGTAPFTEAVYLYLHRQLW